jgi:hypothetical protein
MSRETALQIFKGPTNLETPQPPTAEPPQPGLVPAAEVTSATGEAAGAAPPVKDSPDDKFGQMTKREVKLFKEREEVKREREELQRLKADLEGKIKPFKEFEELLGKDRLAALRSLGFTDTDIANSLVDGPKEETAEQKAERIADLKIKQYEERQNAKAQKEQTDRNNEVIKEFRTQRLPAFIKANAEKYEYVAAYGAEGEAQVFEVYNQVIVDSKGQEVLTLDQAAQIVEEYYEERDKEMGNLKKRQPKVEPATEPVPEPAQRGKPEPVRGLTQAARPSVAGTVSRTETKEEKRARLIEKLKRGG